MYISTALPLPILQSQFIPEFLLRELNGLRNKSRPSTYTLPIDATIVIVDNSQNHSVLKFGATRMDSTSLPGAKKLNPLIMETSYQVTY